MCDYLKKNLKLFTFQIALTWYNKVNVNINFECVIISTDNINKLSV